MKKLFVFFIPVFAFAIALNVSVFSKSIKTDMVFEQLLGLKTANAEDTSPPPKAKKKVIKNEKETEDQDGKKCERVRSKDDCPGTGETDCTPTEYSEWSAWQCS